MSKFVDLLDNLTDLKIKIYEAKETLMELNSEQKSLIKQIQGICEHPEYMKKTTKLNFDDEYGKYWYSDYIVKCMVCEKVIRNYTKYASGRIEENKIDN